MHTETEILVNAPAETIWGVMTDVERWPEWTQSVERMELLGGGPLAEGSRVRIKQPRLPALVWTVTQFEVGKSFVWESASMGVRTVASHEIEDGGENRTRVRLSVTQSGLAVAVLSPWLKRVSRRYLDMEAGGLKQRSESGA